MQIVGNILFRTLWPIVLLVLIGFCGFGFLASFEYPGVTVWHVAYAALGLTFVTLAMLNLLPLLRRSRAIR
jgi:hypothetical protein